MVYKKGQFFLNRHIVNQKFSQHGSLAHHKVAYSVFQSGSHSLELLSLDSSLIFPFHLFIPSLVHLIFLLLLPWLPCHFYLVVIEHKQLQNCRYVALSHLRFCRPPAKHHELPRFLTGLYIFYQLNKYANNFQKQINFT